MGREERLSPRPASGNPDQLALDQACRAPGSWWWDQEVPWRWSGSSIDAGRIEEALAATGTATIRKRRLPAEQVV
jgi:hypothetical protein